MYKDSDLSPYRPLPKHNQDSLTYIVRFVCGAIVGLIMGCIVSVYAIIAIFFRNPVAIEEVPTLEYELLLYTVCGVAILFFVLVFGFGAMILGDRFWGKAIQPKSDS